MPKIIRSTIVNAPPEAVWAVLRDFNGHDRWHPALRDVETERGEHPDRIGCVRRLHLQDGRQLREQLLTLSDLEQSFSFCLLDTPVPLFNYVAHVRLFEVTDGARTFWQCESRFDTPKDRLVEMERLVADDFHQAGFDAIRRHLGLTEQLQ